MTPEQWRDVEASLSHPYGRVRLKADEHVLTLSVERGKGLRYVIVVYIDGLIEWKLCTDKEAEAPRKYWREQTVYFYPASKRAEFAKLAKKRGMSADLKEWYAKAATAGGTLRTPSWPNAKALCRHLRKTCTSFELLPAFDAPGEPA